MARVSRILRIDPVVILTEPDQYKNSVRFAAAAIYAEDDRETQRKAEKAKK